QKRGFERGHVYYRIDLPGILQATENEGESLGVRQFIKHIAYLRAAVTPPENVELLKKLRQEQRLALTKGRAAPENSEFDHQYRIAVMHRSGRNPEILGDILVNCATLTRSQSSNAANNIFAEISTEIEGDIRTLAVGPPIRTNLTVPATWGVESFRDEVSYAALKAVQNGLRN
ncbi:MAG: hypothetical protein KDD53_10350, partial [Bdellovibrionales bacterium]|nr:hypothetical protein [Bdellovibrionales bacterium]